MFPSSPILGKFAPVNLRSPVNKAHNLNRGRVAWYLTLPGWYGGAKFYDLMGLNHGTLTNMGNVNSGWRGTTRPIGFGHLLFDGSASNVAVPSGMTARFNGGVIISVASWVKPTVSISGYQSIVDMANRAIGMFFESPTSLYTSIGSPVSAGSGIAISPAFQLDVWQRIMLTCDGVTVRIYVNGKQAGSTTSASVIGTTIGSQALSIGGNPSGVAVLQGSQDDISFWLRALSATEARQDYDLSRQGYPGVLNRVSMWTYNTGGVAVKTYSMILNF